MSGSVEFFSVSWKELSVAIGSRHRGLYRKILKKAEPLFEEVYETEDFEDGPDVEEGIDRWIQDEVRAGEGGALQVEQLGDGLGFLSLIHYFGKQVGSLTHTAEGGDRFRDFLQGKAQPLLDPSLPLAYLLDRPILGVSSALDFSWGGLDAAELAQLAPTLAGDAPDFPDEDESEWILGLWNALGSAAELGKDLVTIYT
jgi:hypothetical protein